MLTLMISLCIVLPQEPSTAADRDSVQGAMVGAARQDPRRTPIVAACEKARDAVVNITASETIQISRWGSMPLDEMFNLPRRPMTRQRTSIGSGFVIHEDGYVVTNAHVAAQGADLEVTFADASHYPAEIVARDAERDLAVLKIEPGKPLQTIPLGRSDDLMIGETTIAIGNPVGMQNTVTTGIVSALHRDLDFNGHVVYGDVIQTDAGINPGNSGGPLLNILGELIGVNTAIRTDAQNIGFAIPVDQLKRLLPDLLDPEKVRRTRFGARVDPGEPRVVQVRDDTPASRAGLSAGDVIQSVGSKPVRSGAEFYMGLLRHQPGDSVELTYNRNGKLGKTTLLLEAAPKLDGRELAYRLYGIRLDTLSEKAARQLGWPRNEGVVLTSVEPNSPAAQAGLQPGDLLYTLGSYRVRGVEEIGAMLDEIRSGVRAEVGVVRMFRQKARLLEAEIVAR